MENKIQKSIPEEVITDVTQKLKEVETILTPYLIALSTEGRMELPKVSDKTLPFVEKIVDYTDSEPQFIPPFMDKEELANDFKVYTQLNPLLIQARILTSGLDDTIMQAGAESYMNSLAYYSSVKQGVKMDIKGAKVVYEDLKGRFAKNKATKTEE